MASMIRLIRLLALLFSLVFPSLYVSLISFNPEMIPTKFAVAVASGRAGVPFPAIFEIFGLELIMEILREATIRLPQQIGSALSIVGVLVIGQAAVQHILWELLVSLVLQGARPTASIHLGHRKRKNQNGRSGCV